MNPDYVIIEMPIAVFDILGFGLKMIELPPEEVYKNIIMEIDRGEKETTKILHEMGSEEIQRVIADLDNDPFSYKIISDSVIFHWNPKSFDREPSHLEKMFLTIILFIKCTVFFQNLFIKKIMLRGAISYGEYLISETPLCFIGSVISEIFDLEKRQEWIGFCISQSAIDFIEPLSERNLSLPIFEYDVPVKCREGLEKKGNQCIEPHYVFDPIKMGLNQMDIWEEVTKELLDDPETGEDIKRKHSNTLSFLIKVMYPRLLPEEKEKIKKIIPNIEEYLESF